MTESSDRKTALIFGVGGQDGAWLSRLLLRDGRRVFGTSRRCEGNDFAGLRRVGVLGRVALLDADPADADSVARTLDAVRPDEIYNLAAQSSVGASFNRPRETVSSVVLGVVNILETIRRDLPGARFYNASSSECFGDTGETAATEETPFRPRSPYGVAKAAAHWAIANYREAYGLFACSGILFNHESPLRPVCYVTQKVTQGAADIAEGRSDQLALGDLDVRRDWGWAPEYVAAMRAMLLQDEPNDFVIATGRSVPLRDLVAAIFAEFGLDWRRHVTTDPAFLRPTDIRCSMGDPSKAARLLGWRAGIGTEALAARLAAAERRRRAGDDGLETVGLETAGSMEQGG